MPGQLASRLGAAWWARAKAYGGNVTLTAPQEAAGLAFWTNLATDYLAEQAQAIVAPGSFVAPSGGGPVTGTGGPIS